MLPSFEKCLEDIAFVHFRVADQGDHLPYGNLSAPSLRMDVVLSHRGEERLGNSEADRAGREVDVVSILCARWIGLRALVAPEILEPF